MERTLAAIRMDIYLMERRRKRIELLIVHMVKSMGIHPSTIKIERFKKARRMYEKVNFRIWELNEELTLKKFI